MLLLALLEAFATCWRAVPMSLVLVAYQLRMVDPPMLPQTTSLSGELAGLSFEPATDAQGHGSTRRSARDRSPDHSEATSDYGA